MIFRHFSKVSISLVTQSCLTLWPMDCSTRDFPVHNQLPELAQTHVRWVGDAIQPSHPLPFPSPPALNLSQDQGFPLNQLKFSWHCITLHMCFMFFLIKYILLYYYLIINKMYFIIIYFLLFPHPAECLIYLSTLACIYLFSFKLWHRLLWNG